MDKVLKSFIICPINNDKSEGRARSELLKDVVIDQALREVEQRHNVIIRSEIDHHDATARDILQGLVKKIVTYDFIFVIIFDNNPNVFYELGIAHSAGRDVNILLASFNERPHLPFDIQQKQAIEFDVSDLSYRAVQDADNNSLGKARKRLVESLSAALCAEPTERTAFGSEFDPLGSHHSKYILHERFTHSLPFHSTESVEFFASARERIALVGISLIQLTRTDEVWPMSTGRSLNFLKMLEVLTVQNRINIDVFIMHEDNSAMPQMLAPFVKSAGDAEYDVTSVRREIQESTQAWREFLERVSAMGGAGRLRLLKIKRGIPYNRLILTDRALIATPYFYHATTNGTGPALQVTHDTSLYKLVIKDLQFLEDAKNTETFSWPETSVAASA